MREFDEHFMAMALREAEKAGNDGEVPLGAVIVAPAVLEPAHDGHPAVYDENPSAAQILGRAHNMTEGLKDATAHAEMLALSQAFAARGSWRLTGTRLYVTKEPCPMCAGAIVLARPESVIWGVSDPKRGGGSCFHIFDHPGINHHPSIVTGVLAAEAKGLLQSFFQAQRFRQVRWRCAVGRARVDAGRAREAEGSVARDRGGEEDVGKAGG